MSRGVRIRRAHGILEGVDFELFLRSLESEFDASRRAEAEALVDELADAERVGIGLVERIAAMRGREIEAILRGGLRARGRVLDARTTWILLAEERGDSLIPVPALVGVAPLAAAAPGGSLSTRIGISTALRALAHEGIPVVVDHDAGRHSGLVRGVFADHFDIETIPSRAPLDSRDRLPTRSIALVTSGVRRIRAFGRVPMDDEAYSA